MVGVEVAERYAHDSRTAWCRNYKAVAVSGDGNVIGGQALISGFNIPILWTGSAAPEQLLQAGTTGPVQNGATFLAEITGISRDGSAIAGIGGPGQQRDAAGAIVGPNTQALRWTRATGFVALGTLASHSAAGASSWAHDVSADGGTIVGWSQQGGVSGNDLYTNDNQLAIQWTQAGGMTALAKLANQVASFAYAVNADGKRDRRRSARPENRCKLHDQSTQRRPLVRRQCANGRGMARGQRP